MVLRFIFPAILFFWNLADYIYEYLYIVWHIIDDESEFYRWK